MISTLYFLFCKMYTVTVLLKDGAIFTLQGYAMKYKVKCKVQSAKCSGRVCEGPGAEPRANGRSLTGALGTALHYAILPCVVQ